jgi:hypothetical protein
MCAEVLSKPKKQPAEVAGCFKNAVILNIFMEITLTSKAEFCNTGRIFVLAVRV